MLLWILLLLKMTKHFRNQHAAVCCGGILKQAMGYCGIMVLKR